MPDNNITKKALAVSMKKLITQRPFSKISIGNICSDCGMSRKSFYYHFKDKYDLVNWIFHSEFLENIDITKYDTGWPLLEDICKYFYSEKDFYKYALQIKGQNSFREYFQEIITPVIAHFAREIYIDIKDSQFHLDFLTDAFLMAIIRWLTQGAQMPPDEFLLNCRKIMFNMAQLVIEDFDKDFSESEKD